MDGDFERARAAFPLKKQMEQYGHAPKNGNWKTMDCPFCGKKSAGVKEIEGKDYFKCFHTSCPTGNDALNEVGYLSQVTGLNRRDAFLTYLKESGVWKEERLAPSVMPGQRKRSRKATFSSGPSPSGDRSSGEASPGSNPDSTPGEAKSSPIEASGGPKPGGEPVVGGNQNVATEPPPLDGAPMEHSSPPATQQDPSEPASSSVESPTEGGDASGASEPYRMDEDQVAAEILASSAPPTEDDGADGGGAPPKGEPNADGEPEDDGENESVWKESRRALQEFYAQMSLRAEDAAALRDKRGFTDETIQACGFVSSERSLKDVLLGLRDRLDGFSDEALVTAGLYVQNVDDHGEPEGAARPASALYGWAPKTRKKSKGSDKFEFDWVMPVVIPYLNSAGDLVYLRPHKWQVKGTPPHLFVARRLGVKESRFKTLVITEGEYKAAAIAQGLKWKVGAAALPGISQGKHWLVWSEVEAWVMSHKPDEVIVVFDNEEKGDPNLPDSYKQDLSARHAAEVWSRYLAERIRGLGVKSKVGRLPNEWRDAKGKADWDGALARLTAEGADVEAQFKKVLRQAVPVRELRESGLFDSAAESIIAAEVAKLFYRPKLPVGGGRELKLAKQLSEAALACENPEDYPIKRGLMECMKAYQSTMGRHYGMSVVPEKSRARWYRRIKEARQNREYAIQKGCELFLEGTPEPVTDFSMEGKFLVETLDGDRQRAVVLRNVHGELSGLVMLDAKSFSRSSEFQMWALKQGNFGWGGNVNHMNALVEDVNVQIALHTVRQVPAFGWEPRSKLWFFKKCALGEDSLGNPVLIQPNESGVIWHEGVGYLLGDRGNGNQEWRQKPPEMHPDLSILDVPFDWAAFRSGCDIVKEPKTEAEITGAFVREIMFHLNRSLGGMGGCAVVAWAMSFAAAPELYWETGQFCGMWGHGSQEAGKTTLVSWIMELHGFHAIQSGIGLKSQATAVGLQITLEQFSNLIVWGDEYESDQAIAEQIKGVIHGNFNREKATKYNPDGVMREVRTAMCVTGEATPGRGASRSRFLTIHMAKEKWEGTKDEQVARRDWMNQHRKHFFFIFRYVLLRRSQFVKGVKKWLKMWSATPELREVGARSDYVSGVTFASFMSLVEMLECHRASEVAEFRAYMIQHCMAAAAAVAVQVNTSKFWGWLYGAFKAEVFGSGSDLLSFFKTTKVVLSYAPGAPNQPNWGSYTLWVNYKAVFPKLAQHLRQQGISLPISASDYAEQMSRLAYWRKPDSVRHGNRVRFGKGSAQVSCWGILLDEHELGYRACSDEEYERISRYPDGALVPEDRREDPRRGDLFEIVEAVEAAMARRERDETGTE